MLNKIKNFRVSFANQCFIALFLGLCVGHFVSGDVVLFFQPFGSAFLKLLKLVVIPLTFSTIIASFAKLDNIALVKRLGLTTMFWFLFTGLIASIIGVLISDLLNPGIHLNIPASNIVASQSELPLSLNAIILSMLPGNLIEDIIAGKVIPVIIVALLIGIILVILHPHTSFLRAFFTEFSKVMLKITQVIIKFSPIGLFSLVMQIGHEYGVTTILHLVVFIFTVYIACFAQIIMYGILLTLFGRKNPFKFIKNIMPAMATAFNTASTLGTLPTTLDVLINKVKVRPIIANFVCPLGAAMKMDGGAIYPAILCVFTANIMHLHLSMHQYVLIIIASTMASVGTAGVPGASFIMATVVLASVGLPLEGITLVIGIDRILDMIRTMTNVTGGAVCSTLVNNSYTKYNKRIKVDAEVNLLIQRNV